MRKEGSIYPSALSFYKESWLTSLFPLVFAAAWWFPKLSAFLTACSPCFLHCFPRRFKQAKLALLLFFKFAAALPHAQRHQLSEQQGTAETVHLHSIYQKLQRDRHGMRGKREDGHVQTGFLHTGERHRFQICSVSVCCLLISLQTWHRQQLCWPPPAKKVELESSCG